MGAFRGHLGPNYGQIHTPTPKYGPKYGIIMGYFRHKTPLYTQIWGALWGNLRHKTPLYTHPTHLSTLKTPAHHPTY